jgi:hypothetical protein
MQILSMLLGVALFSITLWAGIKLVDRYNSRNSIAVAAIIGGVFGLVAPAMPIFFFALPLIALLYLLVNYYELGLIRSVAVVIAMFAANMAVGALVERLSQLAA